MADEDLAPTEGAEAQELAPEEQTDTDTNPVEALASEMGWVPQDQFRGDPEKWRPATEFIKAGGEIQKTTSRELRSLREQMERMSGVTSQLLTDKAAERDAYWQQKHAEAVDAGDHEAARRAVDEIKKSAPQEAGPPPEVQAWIGQNQWFNTDPLANARAIEICERLKHLPVSEQLAQAERGIRKEFPEHFVPAAKPAPATQTGQSRKAAPSNREKGFADMPAESQTMAKDMVRRNPGLTLDAIAKSFWQQGTRRV